MTGSPADHTEPVEADLPARLRGRSGFRSLLESLDLRVGVTGIRGKSSLTRMLDRALRARGWTTYAKVTGTEPVSYADGTPHPIERDGPVMLDETMWEMKRWWPYEAAVVENQAIGPYTMRSFNELFLRPTHILVTNVRRDHQGDIARSREGIARAFGRSVYPEATVLLGEPDPDLRAILREEAEARGAHVVEASPPSEAYIPALESVTLLDALLEEVTGSGLDAETWTDHVADLQRTFRWKPSSRDGLRWFHGAEINDVDSTLIVLDHLFSQDPRPITFVAYFRQDRRDRTASFVPFLRREIRRGRTNRVYLAGDGAETVARRLNAPDIVDVVPDDPSLVPALVDWIARERAGRVMTLANAAPPFPKALAAELRTEDPDPSTSPSGSRASARSSRPSATKPVPGGPR